MEAAACYTVVASPRVKAESNRRTTGFSVMFVAALASVALSTGAASAAVGSADAARCQSMSIDATEQAAACTAILGSQRLPATKMAMVVYDRGIAFSRAANYDAAIADFDTAAQLGLKKNVFYFRALAHFNKHQYEAAIADDTLAIAADPQSADAYNNRGTAYFDIGKYEQSIADYTAALAINPKDEMAYVNRGNAYRTISQDSQAIADFNTAIVLNPKDTGAYLKRAFAESHEGQLFRALTDYDAAFGHALLEARTELPGKKH